MEYEFDENKRVPNKQKYGIDSNEVQALWDDPDLLEIPAKTVEDEGRWLVIGKTGTQFWSAVITYQAFLLQLELIFVGMLTAIP